jgi:hypothetical protein
MFPKEKENPVRNFAIWWNNTFTIDYWYRRKYNIPFNSKQHRDISPLDILIEWEEEQITTLVKNARVEKEDLEDYKKTGKWLRDKVEEIQEDFYDNLSFEAFDD